MNQDPVRVSQVQWTRVFPFLRLFQSASLGCSLSAVLLAYACLAVSWSGSSLINSNLVHGSNVAVSDFPWATWERLWETDDGRIHAINWSLDSLSAPSITPSPLASLRTSALRIWVAKGSARFPGLRDNTPPTPWILHPLLLLWNGLALGIFGSAIARTTATQFCKQTRTGIRKSGGLSVRRLKSIALSIGLVCLFLTVLRGGLWLARLLIAAGDTGHALVSLVWGLMLGVAVAIVLMLLVGGVAWLLSIAAIGTDGCTGAEALSRSLSYVLSHRLWVTCGAVTVTAIALAVRWLLDAILIAAVSVLPAELSKSDPLRRTWMFLIEMIPHAVQLSVFLAGTAILYVLLRQREDGISTEEIDGAL